MTAREFVDKMIAAKRSHCDFLTDYKTRWFLYDNTQADWKIIDPYNKEKYDDRWDVVWPKFYIDEFAFGDERAVITSSRRLDDSPISFEDAMRFEVV